MHFLRHVTPLFLAVLALAACSSTEVSQRQVNTREYLPLPGRILVYDFTADPAAVPPQSGFAISGALSQNPASAQELQLTHELGAEVARLVAHDLEDEGLPAIYAGPYHAGAEQLAVNDVTIHGYFVSVDEGSAAKRMLIGFSSGNTQLTTVVEGFQMTPSGPRLLGSGTITDNGNKAPGMGSSLALMAVTGSPVGLAVNGSMQLLGEATGSSSIEGAAGRTADLVSEQLIDAAERQDWL